MRAIDKISIIALRTKSIAALLSHYHLQNNKDVLTEETLAAISYQIEENLEEVEVLLDEFWKSERLKKTGVEKSLSN